MQPCPYGESQIPIMSIGKIEMKGEPGEGGRPGVTRHGYGGLPWLLMIAVTLRCGESEIDRDHEGAVAGGSAAEGAAAGGSAQRPGAQWPGAGPLTVSSTRLSHCRSPRRVSSAAGPPAAELTRCCAPSKDTGAVPGWTVRTS